MKKLLFSRRCSRMTAVLTAIGSLFLWLFFGKLNFISALSLGLATGCASLAMFPNTFEEDSYSFTGQIVLCGLVPLTIVLGLQRNISLLIYSIPAICLLLHRSVAKFRSVHALFSDNSARSELEDTSRLMWFVLYLAALLLYSASDETALFAVFFTVVFALFFAALYYRSYSGRSLSIPASVEDTIHSKISALRRMSAPGSDDAFRMEALYARVLEYMEKDKPFLSREFKLDDLAMQMMTNRSYLSQTINRKAGKGFPQFVNYHRIRYSLELIDANPAIKVKELAAKCGYNNPVTFTLAFESVVGEPPGSYCQRLNAEAALRRPVSEGRGSHGTHQQKREDLSSSEEQERICPVQ